MKLKFHFILTITLVLSSLIGNCDEVNQTDEEAIRKILHKMAAAFENKDIEFLMDQFSDSMISIANGNVITLSKEQMREQKELQFKDGSYQVSIETIPLLKIAADKKLAVAIAVMSIRHIVNSTNIESSAISVANLFVFEKENGKWVETIEAYTFKQAKR